MSYQALARPQRRRRGNTHGLLKKPTVSSADICSSVAVPTENAVEASKTDRDELFNKNSSKIHPSSFALVYRFISSLTPTPARSPFTFSPCAPSAAPDSYAALQHRATGGVTGSHRPSSNVKICKGQHGCSNIRAAPPAGGI